MNRIKVLCFCLIFNLFFTPNAKAQEDIAAVVNDGVITVSEVRDRTNLVLVSSGLPSNEETRMRVLPQVLNTLIEEELQLQEAKRNNISVSEQEIDQGFATIAQQNNQDLKTFMGILQNSGINIQTMKRQIHSQLAWTKVIQAKLRPQVNISDKDIEDARQRYKRNIGLKEYLLAEIVLGIESPEQQGNTFQVAQRLSKQIRDEKAPFFRVAQQFSKAAGAAQGGDIGWIQQGQLPEELEKVVSTMEKNTVSQPIRSLNNYYILYLRDVREITEESMPEREKIISTLGISRLERLQHALLLDLKSQAFIENRLAGSPSNQSSAL